MISRRSLRSLFPFFSLSLCTNAIIRVFSLLSQTKIRSKKEHLPFLASAIAAARPSPELAPVMTAVGFCCSLGTSVFAAERAPEAETDGAAATARATTDEERAAGEAARDDLRGEAAAAEAEALVATTMLLLVLGAAHADADCELEPPRREHTADPRVAEEERVCILMARRKKGGEEEEEDEDGKGKDELAKKSEESSRRASQAEIFRLLIFSDTTLNWFRNPSFHFALFVLPCRSARREGGGAGKETPWTKRTGPQLFSPSLSFCFSCFGFSLLEARGERESKGRSNSRWAGSLLPFPLVQLRRTGLEQRRAPASSIFLSLSLSSSSAQQRGRAFLPFFPFFDRRSRSEFSFSLRSFASFPSFLFFSSSSFPQNGHPSHRDARDRRRRSRHHAPEPSRQRAAPGW